MTVEITDENFDALSTNNNKPIVLDFWAQSCGPCKTISPYIDALANKYKEQATIGKVNVDVNIELTMKFGVRNIPTVLYLKNGEVVEKQVGSASKITLEEKLKSIL